MNGACMAAQTRKRFQEQEQRRGLLAWAKQSSQNNQAQSQSQSLRPGQPHGTQVQGQPNARSRTSRLSASLRSLNPVGTGAGGRGTSSGVTGKMNGRRGKQRNSIVEEVGESFGDLLDGLDNSDAQPVSH